MLSNSINYAEKVEESRPVEKIKKVLLKKPSEFLPTYYVFVIMLNLPLADY